MIEWKKEEDEEAQGGSEGSKRDQAYSTPSGYPVSWLDRQVRTSVQCHSLLLYLLYFLFVIINWSYCLTPLSFDVLVFFLGCCCCWLLSLSSHASSLARKLHSSIRSIFPPDRKPKKRSGGRKGEGRKWDGMGEREMGEREEVDDDDEEDEGEGRGGDEEEAAVKKFRKKKCFQFFSFFFFFWRRKKCVLAIWRDFRCFDLSLPLLLLGKRNHSETDE